jgi:hypothetical protein
MIISHWIHFRMRDVADKSCRENQSTHFLFNNCFSSENRAFNDMPRKTFVCWLTKATNTHKHTFRICNTTCFSTATMVTRTLLNVTFLRTSPVLFHFIFAVHFIQLRHYETPQPHYYSTLSSQTINVEFLNSCCSWLCVTCVVQKSYLA